MLKNSLTTTHLKKLVDCDYCRLFHHKDTKCKRAPKDAIDQASKPVKKPKPKPKTKQGNQTILPSQITIESQMEPGGDTWTLVLERNNPKKLEIGY